jgi:hypothetical protein
MAHMDPVPSRTILALLNSVIAWLRSRFRRGHSEPPLVGVREPRRPKPTLPAAAVALDERQPPPRRYRLGSKPEPDRSDLAPRRAPRKGQAGLGG